MSAAASTLPAQSMTIAKVKEHIGAIVTGIDLAQPLDAATRKQLYNAAVDSDRKVVEAVASVAAERGVPRAQVALAWLLSKPVLTAPIIGASKSGHLSDAVAAVEVELSEDEIKGL